MEVGFTGHAFRNAWPGLAASEAVHIFHKLK